MSRGWKIAIAILAVLAVLLTLNTIALDNETKDAEVTAEGGRILSLPGGDVQVLDEGARRGSPIVLLHCYACSLHWWDRLAPILARRHRVIRVDLLGFGGSEKPATGYAMEEQAALVAAALNRLGVEGATVVGHSMGANVATELAAQSSELVDRVVNIDQGPDDSYGDLPFVARLGYVPVLGELLMRVLPPFAIEQAYESAFAPGFDLETAFPNPDQVLDDNEAMTYTSYDASASASSDYTDEIPLDQRLIQASVPLLVIFGAEDQLYDDPAAALEAFRDVPGARLAEIPGAGHSPNVERPERTARLILEFAADAGGLEEHPPGKRRPSGKGG